MEPDERRRRRRESILIAAVAAIFLALAIFETRLVHLTNSSSWSGNVTFFLLINLNLLLLVLVMFLVTRQAVKLVLERRRGIFGSRLRTRLAFAFLGLTLAPSVLLFIVAQGLLNTAFDRWFNLRVDNALRGAIEVAQTYYQSAANNALFFARQVGRDAAEHDLFDPRSQKARQKYVDAKRAEYGLAGLTLLSPERQTLSRSLSEDATQMPELTSEVVSELFSVHEVSRTEKLGRGHVVRCGILATADDGSPVGAVVVDYIVPRDVSDEAREITKSYQEYRQLSSMKQPIRSAYTLTMALVTMVVVFIAMWFGFQQAKAITTPLQNLAEGTREVAQGNWDYRFEAGSDSDTEALGNSLNQMTQALRATNSELVERRNYLTRILSNIAAGVVSIDDNDRLTMLNPAAERMLGLRLTQVFGKTSAEVLGRSDLSVVAELVAEAAANPHSEVEQQVKLTGGEQIMTALVSATALSDDSGAYRGVLLFFEDVTHLLRVQRMEAWREVARRLAHEIKNPLTPIQLSAQRLRKRYLNQIPADDREVFDECTTTIVSQVDEMKRLVNEFSTFARLPAVELGVEDLNGLIDEALVLFREGHPQIDFTFDRGSTVPELRLDRAAIKRVMINLLDNAVSACEAVADPGRITLSTRFIPERGVVRIEVADNGTGMSREVKMRLFEPYFSTKRDGTGLGLAIVSAIVSDHQGYVRVLDNQPRGSRFLIELPTGKRTAPERAAVQA